MFSFEDSDSASEACAGMKNFDLANNGRCITVDFAKNSRKEKSRKRGRSSSGMFSVRRYLTFELKLFSRNVWNC